MLCMAHQSLDDDWTLPIINSQKEPTNQGTANVPNPLSLHQSFKMKILHSLKPKPNSPSWSHTRACAEEENQFTVKRTLPEYHSHKDYTSSSA